MASGADGADGAGGATAPAGDGAGGAGAKGTLRSRVCLSCRTLFDHGEDCRGKGHQTVSIVSREGRAKLDDEVWGPDSRARALRNAAKAGAGGAASGSFLDWFSGCNVLDACGAGGVEELAGVAVGLAVLVIGALVGVLVYLLGRWLVRLLREALHKPQPHGALRAPPPPRATVSARGVVRAGKPLPTPWREGSALGWSMELHHARILGGGAMLRDARTAGFEVALDDGRTLRVPPGRLRVLGALTRMDADEPRVAELVAGIDRARKDAATVFPFDHVRALTIEEGDVVELFGDVTHAADASGAAGYRTSAGFVEPIGVPVLRVRKGARTRVTTAPGLDRGDGLADLAGAEHRAEDERMDEASAEANAEDDDGAGGLRARRP